MKNYWLFKTEPDEFSYADLLARGKKGEPWTGIRNYQARNYLRDEVKIGDAVFIYHSSCKNVGVVGIAEVISAAYPDPTVDDDKGRKAGWVCVDVVAVKALPKLVPLAVIKADNTLRDMVLVKYSRLSIQPVKQAEWERVLVLAES
ncbi:MAG: EVE domain-containing protein [Gammaproteobacteria bacterium]|nr:EVE domain-containing protein [Gammaproteobacteria bacterium]